MSFNGAWTTSEHCEKYCQHVKTQQSLLQKVWDDLQIPSEEQTQQLLDTAHKAEEVWKDALRVAERQRDTVREQIDQAQRQTAKLQAELSDEVFPEEEVAQAGPRSLKAHQDLADKDLQKWLRRKAVRQQKYEALKEKCECLREQMGLVGSSVPVKTITLYVLDGLSMELQQLQAERAERQQRLDLHFKELRKMCMVLGEDEGALAAAIHPTLGTSRDAQSSNQDLSERTVDGLRNKTLELQQLERSRAEQGETLMNTLHSLWDALDVQVDDVDRELFGRLMHGPSRLHQSSLDKCMQEVVRLEGARKDLMLGIIDSKRQQLAAVCALSHMSMPPLPEAHPAESGEVAEVLSRVMKQLQVAASEAEGRQDVLAAIQALNAAAAEMEWLSGYEDDPNKYKGRDSTRKIQRAISASEQRKQLPLLISQVEAALESFRTHIGRAFLYDDMEYQTHVLAPLKAQVQEQEDKKAQGTKAHQKSLLASAKKAGRAPTGTPKRTSRAGERSSQDGGIRKPAVASATPFSERRRAEGALSRTASTLSRTESNASRSDVDVTGSNNLADRVSRLLQSAAASPAVSRTASGMSDADRERQVVHTPEIKKIKAIQEDVYTEMEKPCGHIGDQD